MSGENQHPPNGHLPSVASHEGPMTQGFTIRGPRTQGSSIRGPMTQDPMIRVSVIRVSMSRGTA